MSGIGCRVCASPTRFLESAGSTFDECSRCGYAVVAGAREADYWGTGEEATEKPSPYWSSAKSNYFTSALERLALLNGGPGRLLDIGGGVGFFSELAIGQGWDAVSFDVSKSATAYAAEKLGADRAWSALREEARGTFDVVTIWCVVAHTLDPQAIMSSAKAALRPGGVVWITTPNFSFQRRYGNARMRVGKPLPFLADDHLGQFTPQAMNEILAQHGLHDCQYHYVGITERCGLNGGDRGPLLQAKRAWNRLARGAMVAGLPNLTSELQVTARA